MIHSSDFIHPEDEAARRNLEAIPGFSTALKSILKISFEQLYHGLNMANKIRLSEKQLPHLYKKLKPICDKLGIEEPEFYLEMNPNPNAYTYGDTQVFLTITSGLVEHLEDDEIDAVIAHECGHIACRHVLYHTMAYILSFGASGILNIVSKPIQLALMYWSRRSELSADRASAAVMGSPTPVVETMIRLSGGPKWLTKDIDIELYAAQAEEYEKLQENNWDKIQQNYAIMFQSHPFAAIRVNEILKWCKTDQFNNIINGKKQIEMSCPKCGTAIEADWKFCENCGSKL